jgi:hypothetical protein
MPRFVILRHDSPQGEHFDFMLEAGDVLKTWALPRAPAAGVEIDCEALADHRLAYLDYEGPISADRGAVTRWDCGTYVVERQNDEEWAVMLAGDRLAGRATLRRATGDPKRWRFSFVKGDALQSGGITASAAP